MRQISQSPPEFSIPTPFEPLPWHTRGECATVVTAAGEVRPQHYVSTRKPTSVTLLPFESRLELRECPAALPRFFAGASAPVMLDLLICPLLVLFGAVMGSRIFPESFRPSSDSFDVSAYGAFALTICEVETVHSWLTKTGLSWLEKHDDDVGGVTSVPLASA